jgi:predicted nuclease of predicted toxin-antitoxin system
LSLTLLLDEDSQAKLLVRLLQQAGHDVITVNEVGLQGRPDPSVLEYAKQQERLVLTRNCDDFRNLHITNPKHPGILAIYQGSDPSKDMSYRDIVNAVAKIETAQYALAGEFVVLNQWNY